MADLLKPVVLRSTTWRWRALVAGVMVGGVLGFAPTLISRTPLLGWLVKTAARDIRGTVHVGGAQLSWFHSPVLFDVELRDPQGKLIVAAPRVEMSRSLVAVAWDAQHLGTLTVTEPQVHLSAMGKETNLEKVLAAYIEGEPTSRYRTGLEVVFQRGTLLLEDEEIKQHWWVRAVQGTVLVPRERQAAIQIECVGQVEVGGSPKKLEVRVGYRSGEGGPGLPPQIHVDVGTESLPAAAVATFLRRVESGLRFQGILSGRLVVVWNDERPEQPELLIRGQVSGRQVAVLWPTVSPDLIPLGEAECPIHLVWSGGRIVSEGTRLKCQVGAVNFTGTIDLRRDPLALLHQKGIHADCDVDLASLSRWLSRPLQLRDDLRVTAGRLIGHIRSSAAAEGVSWTGNLTASDLRADRLGQTMTWSNPIAIEFEAHQAAVGMPRIDRCVVQTDFGTLQASGTQEELTLEGRCELDRLFDRWRQFVDIGPHIPTGSLNGRLVLTRDRQDTFQIRAEGRIRDASYIVGETTWREPDLQIRLEAQGQVKSEAYRIEAGRAMLADGGDLLTIQLVEPLADVWSFSVASAHFALRGDLGRWLNRCAPLLAEFRDVQAAGSVDASCRVRVGSGLVQADAIDVGVHNLRFAQAGWNIVEPNIRLRVPRLKWQRSDSGHVIEIGDATFTSPALHATFPSFRAERHPPAIWQLSGRGEIQGDLARLQRWYPGLNEEPLAGTLNGTVHMSADAQASRVQGDFTVRQLIVGNSTRPLWTEPVVRLVVGASRSRRGDLVTLENGKLECTGLGLNASGQIIALSTVPEIRLTGTLLYDWERLEPQLRRRLGLDVRVTGRDQRPFRLEGTLSRSRPVVAPASASSSWLAGLKGEGSIGWQSLQVLGCSVGPAQLNARMLGDGWIRFTPVETTLNRGTLRVEPFVKLDEPKPLLILGKNTRLDHAQITAGLSNESLGYLAPAFSGLRDPLGEVSVAVDGAKIPLFDLRQADVWGKVTIHSIKATPGPLLTEITRALKVPVGLHLTKEQTIPVRLVQGRVHHQNLEIPLGDIDLKTSGSVGLDGSLNIFAEFPTPSRWLGKNAPRSLTVVRLPIGGSLAAPRIDPQGLQQIIGRYAAETTGELLKRELEKNLPKWFQGPPKK